MVFTNGLSLALLAIASPCLFLTLEAAGHPGRRHGSAIATVDAPRDAIVPERSLVRREQLLEEREQQRQAARNHHGPKASVVRQELAPGKELPTASFEEQTPLDAAISEEAEARDAEATRAEELEEQRISGTTMMPTDPAAVVEAAGINKKIDLEAELAQEKRMTAQAIEDDKLDDEARREKKKQAKANAPPPVVTGLQAPGQGPPGPPGPKGEEGPPGAAYNITEAEMSRSDENGTPVKFVWLFVLFQLGSAFALWQWFMTRVDALKEKKEAEAEGLRSAAAAAPAGPAAAART